ncbi:SGNH hydrolase [Frondihabitans sucicola]|uniref:SGNH hydrolase n=1 Tax=Frondihabitans sucicola TaxID=1268041 RepID=A0ABN6Y392_9MICO|nr:SGNH hydrolase [Frondihabitans sucicola]
MTQAHPWSRYVAVGDSFTEGIGDPDPASSGGYRGWADRLAEVLASTTDDFAYANLAVRGRLLQQIIDEQAQAALDLRPDLITVSAGGNDIIRPGTDPDEVASRFEGLVETLSSDGATVAIFTGPDIGATPVLGRIRGKVAIYNENVHAIALRNDAIVVDMWALRELADSRMWAPDRLHFSPSGTTRSREPPSPRSPSRTSSSTTSCRRPSLASGARRGAKTWAGRASSSCRGCSAGSATSRPETAAAPNGPTPCR